MKRLASQIRLEKDITFTNLQTKMLVKVFTILHTFSKLSTDTQARLIKNLHSVKLWVEMNKTCSFSCWTNCRFHLLADRSVVKVKKKKKGKCPMLCHYRGPHHWSGWVCYWEQNKLYFCGEKLIRKLKKVIYVTYTWISISNCFYYV